LTDFENAAYMVFMVLLTRVILTFHLNFIIPISKVLFLYIRIIGKIASSFAAVSLQVLTAFTDVNVCGRFNIGCSAARPVISDGSKV